MRHGHLAVASIVLGVACQDDLARGAALGRTGLQKPRLHLLSAEPALAESERPEPAPEPGAAACGDGMLLVHGDYCPRPVHRCLDWIDPPGKFRRCRRYEQPARCTTKRRELRFCIERDEHVAEGEELPLNRRSFVQAKRLCEAQGKRICRESEWNFACEGEDMLPYPYGWARDSSACNADRILIAAGAHMIRDLRSAGGDFPRCVSPFGVRDMAGNLEELVAREDRPTRPALKGAHWLPGRNYCRAHQTIHGPGYSGVETGFRCCSDPLHSPASSAH